MLEPAERILDARLPDDATRCAYLTRFHSCGPTDKITIGSATKALETACFVAHFSTRIDPKALQ